MITPTLRAQPNSPDAINVASYLDRCEAQGRTPTNAEVAAALGLQVQRVRRIRESLGRVSTTRPKGEVGESKTAAIKQIREDWTPELRPVSISMPPEGCENLGRDSRLCASIYPRRGATYCKPCAAALKTHHEARNALHYPTAGTKPAPRTEV